ncbi:MAG: hypothetical protein LBF41_01030 [Deltaproteobacteria bacterium]|jgi:hypothetical protein|nr:hypothetical protein [Deltaproteobacteria bacterium]
MTIIKRRTPAPKDTAEVPKKEKASEITELPNKRDDYKKSETPHGTVYYKRADADGTSPPKRSAPAKNRGSGPKPFAKPRPGPKTFTKPFPETGPKPGSGAGTRPGPGPAPGDGFSRRPTPGPGGKPFRKAPFPPKGGKPPFNDFRKFPADKAANYLDALDAALDRELPLAAKRLRETGELLNDAALSLLNGFESLGNKHSELLEKMGSEEYPELLRAFDEGFDDAIGGFVTAASFQDLSGQRISRVIASVEATADLLSKIREDLKSVPPPRPFRPRPGGGFRGKPPSFRGKPFPKGARGSDPANDRGKPFDAGKPPGKGKSPKTAAKAPGTGKKGHPKKAPESASPGESKLMGPMKDSASQNEIDLIMAELQKSEKKK